MIYQRKIYQSLKDHLAQRQMTVLTGMRRTGKTTLIRQLLAEAPSRNTAYIDLERVDNRELFSEKNYEVILEALKELGISKNEKMYIALDELQLVPNAPSVLKYLYDHYDIKFIVTGSSSYYLKNLFSESLAGRKKIFELFPLDFGEYLTFQNVPWTNRLLDNQRFNSYEYERVKSHYENFIRYGGFPEVAIASTHATKQDILKDIVSAYINIDIVSLSDFRNVNQIYALMKMLASRVGTKLDYSKISRLLGISRSALISYCTFLEKTYLIALVSVIAKRPDREIVKAKKLYFCDTGIVNTLAEISSGSQFENTVFNQLKHTGDISYYSLKNGREIDFILSQHIAYETKESPSSDDATTVANLAKQAGIPNSRLIGRHAVPNMQDYIWGGEIR